MENQTEMSVFVRVVEEQNFSAAARALKLTPSAVSQLIRRLEDRLGARLLNRTTRRVNLTEEGRAFYQRCRPILAAIDEAERAVAEFQEEPRGLLRVAMPLSLGNYHILPLFPDLLTRYRDLKIETIMTDSIMNLVEAQVDVAVRIGPQPDSSLIARRLGSDRRIVVASPAYLERHGTPKTPDDLTDHNCLRQTAVSNLNQWVFQGPDGPRRIEVTGRFEVNNTPALRHAALAGTGLIRVGEFVAGADINAGRLVRVLGDYESPTKMDIFAVYPPNPHLSPKVRAFVDLLVNNFLPVPPWERAAS